MLTGAENLHENMDMFTETFFQGTQDNDIDEDAPHSSYQDEYMNSLEQGMMEFTDPSLTTFAPPIAATGAGASFSNGVFDFEAYENVNDIHESFLGLGHPKEEPFSSQGPQKPAKRALSAEAEESEAKYRRLTKDEPITGTQQSKLPDWVKDADPAVIEQLKDYVEFV